MLDIVISGNEVTHNQTSLINITCSSDLDVQSIQWLNTTNNDEQLVSNLGQQQLVLPIENVTLELNNTMYTCEVKVIFDTDPATITETVTFRVSSK